MSSPRKVSAFTVRRLSTYSRILENLDAKRTETVSSGYLADVAGLTAAQVRKDLSLFGNFGVRGRGYPVRELLPALRGILGIDEVRPAVVVGAGRLGSALASYPYFTDRGFRIVALFDKDPGLVGRSVGEAEVHAAGRIATWVRRNAVSIGILTTPPEAAQEAADRLVAGGIRGILNFTAGSPQVPDHVRVRSVNLSVELEGLSFEIREARKGEAS